MKKINLSCADFYHLHEAIVHKADAIAEQQGGLTRSKDDQFYGYGKGMSNGASINGIVLHYLELNQYDFSDFQFTEIDGKGAPRFNRELLRKLKNEYNQLLKTGLSNEGLLTIPIPYLRAFLTFLGYDDNDWESFKQEQPVLDQLPLINPTSSNKPGRKVRKKKLLFNEDRRLPDGYAIQKLLANTRWHLYSFNYDYQKILRAVVNIKLLGDGKNEVHLQNPSVAYSYTGFLNCRLAAHRIIQMDLVTAKADDMHSHSKFYVNFLEDKLQLLLGKQIGFGHHHNIHATNVLLKKIGPGENAEPRYLDFNDVELHPAICHFLDPRNIAYTLIPRKTFHTLDQLMSWMEVPVTGQPAHFSFRSQNP